jgi:hypothetical protein
MRALLDTPDGLTTSQLARRTNYAQNTMNQAANLAAYDDLIVQVAIAPGPGRPSVWAINPAHRDTIATALDQGNPR